MKNSIAMILVLNSFMVGGIAIASPLVPTPTPVATPPQEKSFNCQISKDATCKSWRHTFTVKALSSDAAEDRCRDLATKKGENFCKIY